MTNGTDQDHEDCTSRDEFEDGLKFTHIVGQTLRGELARTKAQVFAVIDLLMAKGVLNLDEIEALMEKELDKAEQSINVVPDVHVAPVTDKYQADLLVDIDCADRTDLCGAPCCRVPFPISVQDLEEGTVRWDYFRPYKIAQRDDGRCVHLTAERRCGIYETRPAFCRLFDCRTIREVWTDFKGKVVAADVDRLGRSSDTED